MNAGELVRDARRRRGLSQRRLALRAGTSQASVSRIEAGLEEPTVERLRRLLLVLGEQLVLSSSPLASELGRDEIAAARELSPTQRLAESASWNRVTTQLEIAATEQRRGR